MSGRNATGWALRRALAASTALVGAGLLIGLGGRAAPAADFVVTSTADSGAGSLRAAITALNASTDAANTITFSGPAAGGTITLASELPVIRRTVTIDGGSTATTVNGGSTSATTGYRVFFVGDAGQVNGAATNATIQNLTITGANARGGAGGNLGGGGAGLGGAVFVSSTAHVTLSNVVLDGNAATGGRGSSSALDAAGGGGGLGGAGGVLTASALGGGGGGFGSGATGGGTASPNGAAGLLPGGAAAGSGYQGEAAASSAPRRLVCPEEATQKAGAAGA